jgi:hypothetical protein
MKELINEIENGIKEYNKLTTGYNCVKGIGSKAYITKRIDLLREKLLELKKNLN